MSRHKYLTRKGYMISKKEISKKKLDKIKDELTVTPRVNYEYCDEPESFPVFKEDNEYVYTPRYYGIEKFGNPIKKKLGGKKINIKFNGKLREKQVLIAKSCLHDIKKKGGGIISLHTGAGKTVLALYLACQLGYKILVMVHKTFLQDQWFERIQQFIPTAKIGIIRQNKVDVKDKDIVIGMVQSISMIDYKERLRRNKKEVFDVYKEFGVVICDEGHRFPSRVFSQSLHKVTTRYTIALSATPYRQDGMTKVLKWFIGPIIYRLARKGTSNVIIKMFKYNSTHELAREKKRWIRGKIKPDVIKMETNLYKIEDRNQFIINIICSLRKYPDRKLLVLSGRLKHLDKLKKKMDSIIQTEESFELIEPGEYTTSKYIGGMKDYELRHSAEADVIFATYSMAAEGLDIDSLNTLIFATPKKNIIQSSGRIMRKPLHQMDIKPMVIDIADDYSVFKNWAKIRMQYYRKNKYTVDVYHDWNDKCITIKEYLIKKRIIKKKDENVDIFKTYVCYKYSDIHYKLAIQHKNKRFGCIDYNYEDDLDKIFNSSGEINKTTDENSTDSDTDSDTD